MKKFFIPILSLFLFAAPVQASITEGNATVHVTTNTSVEGAGTVSTHVETTVNGKTTIFDSNKPGEHTIDVNSNGPTMTTTIDASGEADVTATPSPHIQKTSHGFSILQTIKDFLKNLIHWF